jgi:hypothetical protein
MLFSSTDARRSIEASGRLRALASGSSGGEGRVEPQSVDPEASRGICRIRVSGPDCAGGGDIKGSGCDGGRICSSRSDNLFKINLVSVGSLYA